MSATHRLVTCTGDLLPDYREPGYLRRLARMANGLRRPRSSREHKEAVIEAQRLSAPAAALLLPALAVVLLTALTAPPPLDRTSYEIQLSPESPPRALDMSAAPLPPEDAFVAFEVDTAIPAPDVAAPSDSSARERPSCPADSAALAPLRRIAGTCLLPGLMGENRGGAARGVLIDKYYGDQATEDAVMRALRWLKKNQQSDGSWNSQKIAMTGLALLSFLAHGEVPDTAKAPEFGETVHRAIEHLLRSQKPDGRFTGADGNDYAHPIATYALCEAYGMTLNPNVKAAAEKALAPLVRGQHPTGGWTYKMDPSPSPETGAYRDDTSYMGWCVQAVKAAQLAKLKVDGLDKAAKLAIRGFKRNASPNGGFGYTGPGQGGLTGVGALCLQLLGAGGEAEAKRSVELMDPWQPSFEAKGAIGASFQYYCYYATQSKFHSGGKRWERWNKAMKPLYVRAQHIERGAAKDDKGNAVDIGWWVNSDAHSDRPVMDTCLAALQLMVYYRNLPTTTQAAVEAPCKTLASVGDPDDIPVSLPLDI